MMIILAFIVSLVLQLGTPSFPQQTPRPESTHDLALESFDVFFDHFRASKHFQLKRTVFPMEQIDIRLETETSTRNFVQKADWKALKFNKQGILQPIGGENITQEIKSESTVVRLEIRGTDSGIFDDYEFERRVGKWYLVLKRSYSN
ncbi:MAG: hypothetical protein RLZZ519_1684 [Bacteroidota bacterium]|jgi:hypothetical protein